MADLEHEDFINLGIVLNAKGEVLMIRRAKKETGQNGSVLEWAFPGGKQRFGEGREECVKREILAETGYDVESHREISMRIHPQFPVFIIYHFCKLNSPESIAKPSEPHEIAEVKWVKDEWPFLEPFVEIEGKTEREVKATSKKLGFDYSKAWFCATGLIYSKKYNIPVEIIDNKIPKITFDIENPFLKIKNNRL